MPRNFEIKGEIHGQQRSIYIPRVWGRSDGFRLTIYMRNKEELEYVLGLEGRVSGKNLELWIDSGEAGEEGQEANQGITIISRPR